MLKAQGFVENLMRWVCDSTIFGILSLHCYDNLRGIASNIVFNVTDVFKKGLMYTTDLRPNLLNFKQMKETNRIWMRVNR